MRIDLVSSLTCDDETTLAPALLAAIRGFFDVLPIAYSVRVTTSCGEAFGLTRLEPVAAGSPLLSSGFSGGNPG